MVARITLSVLIAVAIVIFVAFSDFKSNENLDELNFSFSDSETMIENEAKPEQAKPFVQSGFPIESAGSFLVNDTRSINIGNILNIDDYTSHIEAVQKGASDIGEPMEMEQYLDWLRAQSYETIEIGEPLDVDEYLNNTAGSKTVNIGEPMSVQEYLFRKQSGSALIGEDMTERIDQYLKERSDSKDH